MDVIVNKFMDADRSNVIPEGVDDPSPLSSDLSVWALVCRKSEPKKTFTGLNPRNFQEGLD